MRIPFSDKDRNELFKKLVQVLSSNRLAEGEMLDNFEDTFAASIQLHAAALSSGGASLLAILDYIGVHGKRVALPANTFWATSQAVRFAGGTPVYLDCNREELCLSYDALSRVLSKDFGAVIVVHIGGHIAFDIHSISDLCSALKVPLVEDCAHATGASWKGRFPGSWGIGGAYSLYATKPLTTGEGGFVVSKDEKLIAFTKQYRNYGKIVKERTVQYMKGRSFNFRMNEVTAALGMIQMARFPQMLEWKHKLAEKLDLIFPDRIFFPTGMKSGYYKYIVFGQKPNITTGQVYSRTDQCHNIEGSGEEFPNSSWIADNHSCVPVYYGWPSAECSPDHLQAILLGEATPL